MVKRNGNIAKLKAGYLFPEISKRVQKMRDKNPDAKIISCGIGDTTEPIPQSVTKAMQDRLSELSNDKTYEGYGPAQGYENLRTRIAEKFYPEMASADEVFISDGAKCDLGRLQVMFGEDVTVAIQDPAYPVYVDTSVVMGMTGPHVEGNGHYEGITYMPCTPENNFFPDLNNTPRTDIIFICSPNNPTGAVATREQLTELVAFAKKNKSIIVYDSAYATYIQDENLPKSIYEIPGAREVAIETGSFSKFVGFTGVRLGWCVVPDEIKFDDGHPVIKDWSRLHSTFFNGASNVVQSGGLAALEDGAWSEIEKIIQGYMGNVSILKAVFDRLGYTSYGGDNAPYLWVKFPSMGSWEAFEYVLNEMHVITTPGVGFGPSGEGFLRFSAFGSRESIEEAAKRLEAVPCNP